MMSLKEFSNGLAKIREGLDMLEIKGRENAAVLVYCHDRCSELLTGLEEVMRQMTKERFKMEEKTEDGGMNEPDSGIPGQD